MKKFLLFLNIIFLNIFIFGFELNGTVFDEKLLPIEGAQIKTSISQGTFSSSEGSFFLEELPPEFELEVSKEGFETYNRTVNLVDDSTFSIMLKKNNKKTVTVSNPQLSTQSLYGLGGGFNLIYPYILNEESSMFTYSYFSLSGRDENDEKVRRNSNSLKYLKAFEENIELAFSIIISEDEEFEVLNEENIVSMKYKFVELPLSFFAFNRGGNTSIGVSNEYIIEDNLYSITNLYYNLSSNDFIVDNGLLFIKENRRICLELLRNSNNKLTTYVINYDIEFEDYTFSLYHGNNRDLDYQYTGISAGFIF
ncbi:MAG: carboxypeptidase regulatory-like domain-containing protein [Candidatus Muiribacteriota bacterium]